MLVGWELYREDRMNAWVPRIISISPPRTGAVEYLVGTVPGRDVTGFWHSLQNDDPNTGTFQSIRDRYTGTNRTVEFAMHRCGVADVEYEAIPHNWVSEGSLTELALVLLPINWNETERPELLMTEPILGKRVLEETNLGGVFGTPPSLRSDAAPAQRIEAKPGAGISLVSQIRSVDSGGTLRSFLSLEIRESRSSASDQVSLNREEVAEIRGDLTMPALLPRERGRSEISHALELCDVESLTKTDKGRRDIEAKLETALPRAVRLTSEIIPTDALLVGTEAGAFEILGRDLTYEGVALPRDGPAKPLRGSSPDHVEIGPLAYLFLKLSRPLAIAEDRQLISDSDDSYEYSALPTPRAPLKAGKWAFTNLRPVVGRSRLPTPRILARGISVDSKMVDGRR